ncbi:MAG TPA: PAS domain S-box protein, partial [Thermoguttaceae bacterium]|nr:PAS domain S-box protein [Thermoguttaceae bacterium]
MPGPCVMYQYSKVRIFLVVIFLLVGCDIALSLVPADKVEPSSLMAYCVGLPRGLLSAVAMAPLIFAFWRLNYLEWRSREKQRHLEESERQLRTITSSARDAIIMIDSDGKISFWNEAATRIFGFDVDEVITRNVASLIVPPRLHAAFWKSLPRFRETGAAAAVNQTMELTALRKGGEQFPIELSFSAVRLRDQWHGVAVARDVTERRRAEEALRFRLESERVVNEIFTCLMVVTAREYFGAYRDALGILGKFVNADQGGVFVFSEDKTRLRCLGSWGGSTEGRAKSLPLRPENLSWWTRELGRGEVVHVANVDALPEEAKRQLRVLDAPLTGALLATPLMLGDDLHGLMLLHWPHAIRSWRAEHVALAKTCAFTFTGTSVRIQAMEENLAAHAELTHVFNAAAPLCVISRDLTVLRVNESFCSFFELDRGAVVGRKCQDVWSASTCMGLEAVIRQIREGESRVEYEEDRSLADGRAVSCFITATPYRGSDGELVGIVTSLTDITDRKQAEQETRDYALALESANEALEQFNEIANAATRAKSDFLANMSHEIRTPMTAILGFAEVLRDSQLTQDERRTAVDTILRNGQHLLQLINDILDLSKIESGKMVLERIPCWPIEISRDVVSLLNLRATSKGLSLVLKFEGPIPEVIQTDPTRLRQILINLVANAVKFTETGGVRMVVRRVEEEGRTWLHWEVVDSGIGMTSEQVGRVFEPFTQADGTVTRKYGGTGLGLAISWRMAQAMGGTISVQSAPGHGSTFCVAVPLETSADVRLVENPAEWRPASSDAERSQTNDLKLTGRVLLAEDGRDNQRLIAFLLRKAGLQVAIADNGLIACEKVREAAESGTPYDLVLMDMQMPELDGYAAASRLRGEGFSLPIIALTAHAMADDRQKCVAAGCDDFATKPIQRADLLALVARYLR